MNPLQRPGCEQIITGHLCDGADICRQRVCVSIEGRCMPDAPSILQLLCYTGMVLLLGISVPLSNMITTCTPVSPLVTKVPALHVG